MKALNLSAIYRKLRPLGGGSVTVDLSPRNPRIAEIVISNPSSKNALTGKMMTDFSLAVVSLGNDAKFKDTVAVCIRGEEGSGFCSGADLSVLKDSFAKEDGAAMCHYMQCTLDGLRSLPQISVAAVEGFAVGGGTELALSCDFRVFSHNTKFHMVQTKMGLTTGWGGGARLTQMVGRQKAIHLLPGSKRLTSMESLDWGIADKVADENENVMDAAIEFLEPFTSAPYSDAVRVCKRVIAEADDLPMEQALKIEAGYFTKLWGGPSNADAFAQLAAKDKNKKK